MYELVKIILSGFLIGHLGNVIYCEIVQFNQHIRHMDKCTSDFIKGKMNVDDWLSNMWGTKK